MPVISFAQKKYSDKYNSSIDTTITANYTAQNVSSINVVSDVRTGDNIIYLPAPTAVIKGRSITITHQDSTSVNLGITQVQTDSTSTHFWDGSTKTLLQITNSEVYIELSVQEINGVMYWVKKITDAIHRTGLPFKSGANSWTGTTTNHTFSLRTNNLTRLNVTSSGLVGIGQTVVPNQTVPSGESHTLNIWENQLNATRLARIGFVEILKGGNPSYTGQGIRCDGANRALQFVAGTSNTTDDHFMLLSAVGEGAGVRRNSEIDAVRVRAGNFNPSAGGSYNAMNINYGYRTDSASNAYIRGLKIVGQTIGVDTDRHYALWSLRGRGYFGGTSALRIHTGTTVQRPVNPDEGDLRINSESENIEFYLNGVWNSPSTDGGVSIDAFSQLAHSYKIGDGLVRTVSGYITPSNNEYPDVVVIDTIGLDSVIVANAGIVDTVINSIGWGTIADGNYYHTDSLGTSGAADSIKRLIFRKISGRIFLFPKEVDQTTTGMASFDIQTAQSIETLTDGDSFFLSGDKVSQSNVLDGVSYTDLGSTVSAIVTKVDSNQYNINVVDTISFTANLYAVNAIDVTTAGSAVTVTVPASPPEGAWFIVSDAISNSSIHNIIVDFNGGPVNFQGSAIDDVISTDGASGHYVYINSAIGWTKI